MSFSAISRTMLAAGAVVMAGIGAASAIDACNPCAAPNTCDTAVYTTACDPCGVPAPAPAPMPVVNACDPCGDPVPAPMPMPVVNPCDPCAPAPAPVVKPVVACVQPDPCDPCAKRGGFRWFGWFRPQPKQTYYSRPNYYYSGQRSYYNSSDPWAGYR